MVTMDLFLSLIGLAGFFADLGYVVIVVQYTCVHFFKNDVCYFGDWLIHCGRLCLSRCWYLKLVPMSLVASFVLWACRLLVSDWWIFCMHRTQLRTGVPTFLDSVFSESWWMTSCTCMRYKFGTSCYRLLCDRDHIWMDRCGHCKVTNAKMQIAINNFWIIKGLFWNYFYIVSGAVCLVCYCMSYGEDGHSHVKHVLWPLCRAQN